MSWRLWTAIALALGTTGCHATARPLRLPAAAGVWLGPAWNLGDAAPEWARSGEGLSLRLMGVGPASGAQARALQWVSPAPWTLADVDRVEFILMDPSDQVLATRTEIIAGALPPEGLHLVLRHLKPHTPYRFKMRAFTATHESIEDPSANVTSLSTNYQAAPFVSAYLPLKAKHFPGRLVASLNPPNLGQGLFRRVVLERDEGDAHYVEVASKTIGSEYGPPPVEFLGVAPGATYRVQVESWATGAGEPSAIFQGVDSFLVAGDADGSGTWAWSAPSVGL